MGKTVAPHHAVIGMRPPADRQGDGKTVGGVVLASVLPVLGWVVLIGQLVQLSSFGALAPAGPGMSAIDWLRLHVFADMAARIDQGAPCSVETWSADDTRNMVLMWVAMIFAMMLPHLLIGAHRRRNSLGRLMGWQGLEHILGNLVAWMPFCALAMTVQYLLTMHGIMSGWMVIKSASLQLLILAIAGILWLFRSQSGRSAGDPDISLGFAAGLRQGRRCILDCSVMISVMFAVGLMNIVAMAAMATLPLLVHGSRRSPRLESL